MDRRRSKLPTLSIITSSEGTYTYDAEVAGVHTLQYSVGGLFQPLKLRFQPRTPWPAWRLTFDR